MEKIYNNKFKLEYLKNPFFDSLRKDYANFDDWFETASKEDNKKASYIFEGGELKAFFGFKIEEGIFDSRLDNRNENYDIEELNKKRIKITTLKAEKTLHRMSEFAIMSAYKMAMDHNAHMVYLSIIKDTEDKKKLAEILEYHGFVNIGFESPRINNRKNNETFYVKYFNKISDNQDPIKKIPLVTRNPISKGKRIAILPIENYWHDTMFQLNTLANTFQNPKNEMVVSGSIKKTYIHGMKSINALKKGDLVLIYYKSNAKVAAGHKSCITGVAYVDQNLGKKFNSFKEFEKSVGNTSVFGKEDLMKYFKKGYYITKLIYVGGFGKNHNSATWHYIKNKNPQKREGKRPQEWKITDDEYNDIIVNKGGWNVRNFITDKT